MPAFWFAFGCMIVEVIYVRISLSAMNWVTRNNKILKLMTYIILFITIAFATVSFVAAFRSSSTTGDDFKITSTFGAFILGLALSAINPAQIPFWFGFSALLQSKKILLPDRYFFGIYMAAIGVGSMMASFIFIYAGQFMIKGIGENNLVINIVVGSCFAIAALVQTIRIFIKKGTKNQFGNAN